MRFAAFEVDRAIGFTLLNRAWGLVAGPATLVFIVARLTPIEQGFYYAFASVLGMQIFFELGLGFVTTMTVSHLAAGIQIKGARASGESSLLGQLGRLLADLLRWYSCASAGFIATVLVAGFWFMGRASGSEHVAWQMPWLLVVPIFGLTILTNACFSFLEGLGLVEDVAFGRLVQNVLGLISLCVLLGLGAKLHALIALYSVNLAVASTWILLRHGTLLGSIWAQRAAAGAIAWRSDIWPFQWRIALSWIAGYLGTQAITLVVFARLGPVDAGRFGLTLTVLSAVAAGATAWLSTKAPSFGRLVAQHKYADLNKMYAQAWQGSLRFGLLGMLLVFAGASLLHAAHLPWGQRFVPLPGLAAMALATLVNIKVSAEATYLRAFRREPYLALSIAVGSLQVMVAAGVATTSSVLFVALAYSAVSVGIGLAWAHPLFVRLRREFLAQEDECA